MRLQIPDDLFQSILPDIPVRILRALAEVESNGKGWENDRPKIRFENHLFLDKCPDALGTFFVDRGVKRWTNHQFMTDEGIKFTHESQETELKALNLAKNICFEAAFESISIGTFQLHTMHYKEIGFPSAFLMYAFMSESPERELEVLRKFIQITPGLKEALVAEDLEAIHQIWNSGNQAWLDRLKYVWSKLG